MPTYRVVGKPHVRATTRDDTAIDSRGNLITVRNAADPVRFPVGSVLTDVRPEELTAFGDRFQLVSEEPLQLDGTLFLRPVNPELFDFLRRANEGQATEDEREAVGLLIDFLEHQSTGTVTPEETDTLVALFDEFGLSLFA